ncbi:MerR family transcriptional regulator [Cytobacillus purgationiresistens]|uniref:DNA-binding transcriptional MerR regulator n=1 Tax=Cytobacillus purgationiresistens TaxID=863449 RepID=A0ABU0AKN6_9BACI|nr:MerR family transcriptional regulator [Cytobacillus purgationiresistens]MDQ0271817.1 DNA-binding transcriptional MerR regulator [Cytobacillus purgationiresistens]
MIGQYSIGEFSKKTKTTIRTLHYYDEIDVLKPAFITSAGRRYYSDDEIIRLQKIVSLKYLGYSLEDIREFIHLSDWDLKESILFQKQEMNRKKEHIERVIRTLDHALQIIEDKEKVDSSIFISLIHSIQMENEQKEWLKELVSEDIVEDLFNIPEDKQLSMSKKTATLFSNLKQTYKQEPSSPHVQSLIDELWGIINELYPDSTTLFKKLLEKQDELENYLESEPAIFPSPFTSEEEKWLGKAMEIYFKGKGLIPDEEQANGNEGAPS